MTGRVSDVSLSQNAIQYLQASLSGVADLQAEASSGKKLTKPSDSPRMSALPTAWKGILPTLTVKPSRSHSSWVRPIDAICGRE